MADESTGAGSSPLPPKLDLRKSGILKAAPPVVPATPATPAPESAPPRPAPAASSPGTPPPAGVAAGTTAGATSGGASPAGAGVGTAPRSPVFRPVGSPVGTPTPTGDRPAGARLAPIGSGMKPAAGGGAPAPRPFVAPKPAAPASDAPKPVIALDPAGKDDVPPVDAGNPPERRSPMTVATPVSKKETSRIPLTAARPRPDSPTTGKPEEKRSTTGLPTIPAAIKVAKMGETTPLAVIPKPSEVISAEKRKTSRISLDAVLGDSSEQSENDSVKTIRLKRPGEAPTVKVGGAPRPPGGATDPEATPPAGTTQRKTVIVKRSAESGGARKLSVARPTSTPADEPAGGVGAGEFFVIAPQPHWAFGVIAVAATLVAVVVVYLFLTQAVGPNSSKTLYSSAPGGPDLMWPGKIAGQY